MPQVEKMEQENQFYDCSVNLYNNLSTLTQNHTVVLVRINIHLIIIILALTLSFYCGLIMVHTSLITVHAS